MKDKFKILFIDVLDPRVKFQSSYPHLGIGYLISSLLRSEPKINVLVINKDYVRNFKHFMPDVVAISCVTQNYNLAKQICRNIKQLNHKCPIVIGGIHISQLPLSLDYSMDIAVLGEGEEAFLDVIRNMMQKANFHDCFEKLNGIAFWKDGNIIITGQRDVIRNLDTIPHPNRYLLPNRQNQLLLTSRGCPYKCAFCASAHYWNKVRYFSTDYIIEEIGIIIRSFPVLNLFIFDDLFVFNKIRLRDISANIVRAGFHKKLSFWCTARANHIDEESVGYLKSMNVKGVGMGLESGSDKVLKSLKNATVSVDINRTAINLCRKNNILVHGSFMLGCPGETQEDMLKTRDFIKTSAIDKGDITAATPLPGTDFWKYALKEGLVSENNMDWSTLSYRYTDVLPTLENCLLLSKEVSKQTFIKIFKEITEELTLKRLEYEKKWSKIQGGEIRLRSIFSYLILIKIIREPLRALRYMTSYLLSIPMRFKSHRF